MGIQIEKPENAIPGQYIFDLDDKAVPPDMVKIVAEQLLAPQSGTLLDVYTGSLIGFSANGLDDAKVLEIAKDPRVIGISQDFVVQVDGTQSNAPWGLDRIDSKVATLDSQYSYSYTGKGVHVYILDTGIRTTHQEFGGRALANDGADFVGDGKGVQDCHGHGTHVAGIVGGATYGVAKEVFLHPVRIADCNGAATGSKVIAGLDWVRVNKKYPAIANMSMGGPVSSLVDKAATNLNATTVPLVVSAGNSGTDACKGSPGRIFQTITVGATDKTDTRPNWSNWGPCVDLFAPGDMIESASIASDTAVAVTSGTSQAAPMVTGAAAIFMGVTPIASILDVQNALVNGSVAGLVKSTNGSPNNFLYSRFMDPKTGFEKLAEWQNELDQNAGWLKQSASYYTLSHPELNGDGKKDLCVRLTYQGIFCSLSDGMKFGPMKPATPYFDDTAFPSDPYWGTIQYGDINGDGLDDLCGRRGNGFICGTSDGMGGFPNVQIWTTEFNDGSFWETNQKYWGTIRLVDVNGDGKQDVCARFPDGIHCGLSTGTAFAPTTVWTNSYGDGNGFDALASYWGLLRYPDLNGDGKADVCARASNGLVCGISDGTKFTAVKYWDDYYTDAGPWDDNPKYWATIQFADINGDKMMDVCGRAENGIVCRHALPGTFGPVMLMTPFFSDANGLGNADNLWGTIRFPDLNGDGKADVCGRHPAGFHCGLSTGGSFEPVTLWDNYYTNDGPWDDFPQHWASIRFADINGDKKADICGLADMALTCMQAP